MNVIKTWRIAKKIPGHLSTIHGLFLYFYAWRAKGDIVEVGSYRGKSTTWLAGGTKHRVYAVDDFRGVAEHPGETPDQLYTAFKKNTEQFDNIVLLRGESAKVAEGFIGKLGLLFIDGDHEVDSIRADYVAWGKFLDGPVIFHDVFVRPKPGPTIFLKELLGTHRKFHFVGIIAKAERGKSKNNLARLFFRWNCRRKGLA